MCDAVRSEVRYHTKDHNQQTRADRNILAGLTEHGGVKFVVEGEGAKRRGRAVFPIPERGAHLWRIFWQVSAHRVERSRIEPGKIADWLRLHRQRISTLEADVIDAMDRQFIATLSEEIAFNDARRKPK